MTQALSFKSKKMTKKMAKVLAGSFFFFETESEKYDHILFDPKKGHAGVPLILAWICVKKLKTK